MNIYIYGSNDFKKEMNSLIDHSNLRLRMGDDDSIVELEGIEEIQDAIIDHPDDIFLIDDKKIIKENALNKKLKFLIPKDGISQAFLDEHGIGNEMSFDSMKGLSKYLISRYEELEDEDFLENRDEIQESIIDIVDEAYSEDEEEHKEESNEEDFSPELDDELNMLLSQIKKDKPEEDDAFNEEKNLLEEIDQEDSSTTEDDLDALLQSLNDNEDESHESQEDSELDDILNELNGTSSNEEEDEDNDLDSLLKAMDEQSDLGEEKSEAELEAQAELDDLLNSIEEQEGQGVSMIDDPAFDEDPDEGGTDFEALMSALDEPQESSDKEETKGELLNEYDIPTIPVSHSEEEGELMGDQLNLDDINENEMLSAFGAEAVEQSSSVVESVAQRVESNSASDDKVSLNLTNPEELSTVLSELLKNKTLEITVKVKE